MNFMVMCHINRVKYQVVAPMKSVKYQIMTPMKVFISGHCLHGGIAHGKCCTVLDPYLHESLFQYQILAYMESRCLLTF